MIQTKLYPVNTVDTRRNNKFIVISHTSNFVLKTHPFPPDLRHRTTYNSLPELREYYRELVEMRQMPFHYHVSKLKREWECLTAAPNHFRSPILDEAAENYYVEDKYKDAILVCIQDDYSLNTPDDRTFEVIASNIIAPFLQYNRLDFRQSVFFFDEIFSWEKYEEDKLRNPLGMQYRWETNKMKYFDRVIFNLDSLRYF